MNLEEFLGGGLMPQPPTDTNQTSPGQSPDQTEDGTSVLALPDAPEAENLPYGVATTVTPSGIEIYYQAGPKRLYRVRGTEAVFRHRCDGNGCDGCGPTEAMTEWVEVPSVTTVLDDQPPAWWGMRVGIAGIAELEQELSGNDLVAFRSMLATANPRDIRDGFAKDLERLLTYHKLCTNNVTRRAGKRGTSVHKGLEVWAETGVLPSPEVFPEEEAGYVRGLRAFLEAGYFENVQSEVLVGSLEHGFAGRYDLRADLSAQWVTNRNRKSGEVELFTGRGLLDLKTSKDDRAKYHHQLEGYEGASVECGYEPTDFRAVVIVGADGSYEVRRTRHATYEGFLAKRAAWAADNAAELDLRRRQPK